MASRGVEAGEAKPTTVKERFTPNKLSSPQISTVHKERNLYIFAMTHFSLNTQEKEKINHSFSVIQTHLSSRIKHSLENLQRSASHCEYF